MDLSVRLVTLLSALLMFHSQISESNAAASVFSFIHDLIQYNVAGVPVIHEQTQWDFDPELGKQRRVRYEAENGRYGEYAIAKVGMGIGYKGPWGTVVSKGNSVG